MYVVTNRKLDARRKGLEIFGQAPSERGPNELRMVRVERRGSGYETELLDDRLLLKEVRAFKSELDLDIDEHEVRGASLGVACALMRQARDEGRHVLIYVHGYNNDMADVLATAEAIEALYGVLVVPFSWPANGGGTVSGTLAYLDDKQDARISLDALNRFLGKLGFYYRKLTEPQRTKLMERARREHPDNPARAQAQFGRLLNQACPVRLSLLCHSMGNYLLKYALGPSTAAARELIFDNVALVAADANNEDHARWVDRIQVRNRLYIVINENDGALEWSRRKPGAEQLARLGHYLRRLDARDAYYIDVTHAAGVDTAHNYFTEVVDHNDRLRAFFQKAFSGGRADATLPYAADLNVYRLGEPS